MRLKSGNDYTVLVPMGVFLLVVLAVDLLGWLSGFRVVSERVVQPVTQGMLHVGRFVGEPFHAFRFVMSGPQRVADLESRYAEALVGSEQVVTLQAENESLRTLLGSGTRSEYDYFLIPVTSMAGDLALALGSARGVLVGDTLVDERHVVVGRVHKVSYWTSWAQRVTDERSSISVSIGNQKVVGTMKGDGEKGIIEVEQADNVRIGDRVMTADPQGELVPGLLVGRVIEVESESSSVYKKVWVECLGRPTHFVYAVRAEEFI